jgi:serine/threonine protein kinase
MEDIKDYGYEYIRELGSNVAGGRITNLFKRSSDNALVVIKQFQFLKSNSSWNGFKAIEREVSILKQLDHSNIPKYFDTFETSNGSCLVQEYIDAPSLAEIITTPRLFTPDQIKSVISKLLEIIVYLQTEFTEPVIHRDIKPANILIDDQGNPYLIDFGGAKVSEGEGGSTVAAGTLGFMPPEQRILKFNQTTDVYSLGLTIICWLTRTEPSEMNNIINPANNKVIGLMKQLSSYSPRFIDWLEKVVAPDSRERYPDAKSTLKAFEPIYVKRLPRVLLNESNLSAKSKKIGDRLKVTITVRNDMPETTLEGGWTVEQHSSDPESSLEKHRWIHFSPQQFKSNHSEFVVFIETQLLMANTKYNRKLLLHTNGDSEIVEVPLTVQTALMPTGRRAIPWFELLAAWGVSFIAPFILLCAILLVVAILYVVFWILVVAIVAIIALTVVFLGGSS